MLLLGPTQTDRKKFRGGQKTPYYNRPTQDGLSGHFVLRAIGKRFRKDRTAGCEKVVGIRFALDSSLEEGVCCELVSEIGYRAGAGIMRDSEGFMDDNGGVRRSFWVRSRRNLVLCSRWLLLLFRS